MTTAVESTAKSSPGPSKSGAVLPPSERAVACRCSTVTECSSSDESARALTCLLLGLLRETLSADSIFLAIQRAAALAVENNVSPKEFQRVAEIVMRDWKSRRGNNPMSGLF